MNVQGVVDHATASAILERLKRQEVQECLKELKQAMVDTTSMLAEICSQLEDITGCIAPSLDIVGISVESDEKTGICYNSPFS